MATNKPLAALSRIATPIIALVNTIRIIDPIRGTPGIESGPKANVALLDDNVNHKQCAVEYLKEQQHPGLTELEANVAYSLGSDSLTVLG